MTIIEQIKAEIERLKEENRKIKCQANERYCSGYDDAFYDLVPFLSTLESEKPMDLDGLDEEVHSFFDECIEVYEVPLYGKVKEEVITADCYEITARHFAQWGAERQKEQDDRLVDIIYQQGIEKGKDEMRKTLKRKEKK